MLNILVIGNGQCGNRILDSINRHAMGGGKKTATGLPNSIRSRDLKAMLKPLLLTLLLMT